MKFEILKVTPSYEVTKKRRLANGIKLNAKSREELISEFCSLIAQAYDTSEALALQAIYKSTSIKTH